MLETVRGLEFCTVIQETLGAANGLVVVRHERTKGVGGLDILTLMDRGLRSIRSP